MIKIKTKRKAQKGKYNVCKKNLNLNISKIIFLNCILGNIQKGRMKTFAHNIEFTQFKLYLICRDLNLFKFNQTISFHT